MQSLDSQQVKSAGERRTQKCRTGSFSFEILRHLVSCIFQRTSMSISDFPSISRKQSVGVNWKSEQRVFQRTVKGSLTLMRASSKFRVKQDLF